MPPMPRGYGAEPSGSHGRRASVDTQRAPPRTSIPHAWQRISYKYLHLAPMPMHRPTRAEPAYDRGQQFVPPPRPATAMAGPAPPQQQQDGAGNLEWMPPRLKWVKKKERVSHFTPPSQYQGTSFRQYVHDGVTPRNNNS
jgi:hypothetical protein